MTYLTFRCQLSQTPSAKSFNFTPLWLTFAAVGETKNKKEYPISIMEDENHFYGFALDELKSERKLIGSFHLIKQFRLYFSDLFVCRSEMACFVLQKRNKQNLQAHSQDERRQANG